jgi:hypothetical protein
MATSEKIAEFRGLANEFARKPMSPSFLAEAYEAHTTRSTPRLGDDFKTSASQDGQNAREIAFASDAKAGINGSGATSGARGADQKETDAKKRKASNDTATFLRMLQALEAQIKALEERIEHYDNQIEATDSLINIVASGGEIDPTNPEHQRLLRLAGIPDDEWGTVTLDDLRKHRDELARERDVAKTQLDKKVAEGVAYESAASNLNQGIPISASSIVPPEAVEEYARRNPDVDLEDLSRRDLLEIRKINLVSEYIARSEHTEKGIEWLKAGYAELRISEVSSDSDFRANFEKLIEELTPNELVMLLQEDHGLDARANAYLAQTKLDQIKATYNLDDPEERMMFEMDLEAFDGIWKSALLSDPNTDQAIKDLLGGNAQVSGQDTALTAEN